jgi:hypothetical protein
MLKSKSDRRSFLTRLSGLSALALISPIADRAGLEAEETESAAAPWDLSWVDQLKGKHKQVFDLGKRELGGDNDVVAGDTPLRVPKNYLNAHKEVYGLESPNVNVVIGIASDAFPMNASDALWLKYGLGEKWKIKDSTTGTWAVRNLFADPALPMGDNGITMQALQKRGAIFWQCNNALNGVVARLAKAMNMEVPVVRAELVAGLMPGVHIVPAHTMAIGLVQEKGCTYEAL